MFFFFFSSRRRHTRCSRDWSSDVCSSDLARCVAPRDFARESAQPGPSDPVGRRGDGGILGGGACPFLRTGLSPGSGPIASRQSAILPLRGSRSISIGAPFGLRSKRNAPAAGDGGGRRHETDRKSTRLNSSHGYISYAVFCLKKKNKTHMTPS